MLRECVLIMFVKYPQPGYVKTRLAESIGKEQASFLYRRFVELLIKRTNDGRFERFIFYTPAEKRRELLSWLGDRLKMFPQRGDDLGQRLSNAFRFAFAKGAHRVVIVGTDIPLLDREVILRAFRELENRQCVIGPSLDGGYYLLGLSHFYAKIFQNIHWGTDEVFSQTLQIIRHLGLTHSLLEEHFDVDDVKDLVRLKLSVRRHEREKLHDLNFLIDVLEKLSINEG